MSLLDNYGANFAMVLFAFLLCGGLSWLYGVRRFKNDIRTMLGNKFVDSWFFMWWPFNWAVLTPMLMGVGSLPFHSLFVYRMLKGRYTIGTVFLKNYVTSEGVVSHNVLYYQQLSNASYQVSF